MNVNFLANVQLFTKLSYKYVHKLYVDLFSVLTILIGLIKNLFNFDSNSFNLVLTLISELIKH